MPPVVALVRRSLLCASLCSSLCAARVLQRPLPDPVPPDEGISASELEGHVRFLAADEMAGRATGTSESLHAAQYLARELEHAGLAPAGDSDSYLQDIGLLRVRYRRAPSLALYDAKGEPVSAVWGVDYELEDGLPRSGRFELDVAREGEVPSAERRPRTAVLLPDARERRDAWLAALDAPRGRGLGALLLTGSKRVGTARQGLPRESLRSSERLWQAPLLRLRGPLAERVQKGELTRLTLELDGSAESAQAVNVIGRLAPSEISGGSAGESAAPAPAHEPQAVVFSAHYDHLGRREPAASESAPADRVYNGADDDASGCAALLEIAETLAREGGRTRELVFLFATGEEIGLLGTNYYIEHPCVPLARTVCNLNFEMIGRPDAAVAGDAQAGGRGCLWLTGYERSNLGPAFAGAGLSIAADPHPEQHFFERSDNYAFARLGIVAQTLSSYNLHADYHHVSDEADTLDWEHLRTAARAGLEAARLLATGKLSPVWTAGGNPAEARKR